MAAPQASLVALVVKNSPVNAGDIRDLSSIPGSTGAPGGGHRNPLQYSCLEHPMDRVPGRPQSTGLQSWTRLKQLACMHGRPNNRTKDYHIALEITRILGALFQEDQICICYYKSQYHIRN